jgi:hypothetical protein
VLLYGKGSYLIKPIGNLNQIDDGPEKGIVSFDLAMLSVKTG